MLLVRLSWEYLGDPQDSLHRRLYCPCTTLEAVVREQERATRWSRLEQAGALGAGSVTGSERRVANQSDQHAARRTWWRG